MSPEDIRALAQDLDNDGEYGWYELHSAVFRACADIVEAAWGYEPDSNPALEKALYALEAIKP